MFKRILTGLTVFLILLFFTGFLLFGYLKGEYYSEIKTKDGVTNFLLLGVNGSNLGDADLTDTIIFVSLDQIKKKATLITIPRDIWMTDIEAKINTAYHYGGLSMAKKEVIEIVGQEIDYISVLNFDGFEKIIDILGGVDIEVQNSFDDFFYPIPGKEADRCDGDREFKCRYEHLRFEKGPQHMDGKTALKFVRSRNAEGDEGTDFARSQRQTLVLKSVKNKLQSPKTYSDIQTVKKIISTLEENIKTEINQKQYGNLLEIAFKIDWNNLKTVTIDEKLLVNPRYHYSKQWVLVSKTGDFSEIHSFVSESLK